MDAREESLNHTTRNPKIWCGQPVIALLVKNGANKRVRQSETDRFITRYVPETF
jgi:hypothetical protein